MRQILMLFFPSPTLTFAFKNSLRTSNLRTKTDSIKRHVSTDTKSFTTIQGINEDAEQDWTLGYTTNYWLPN